MKRWIPLFIAAAAAMVLAGCSTPATIRSDVTAFHEWTPALAGQSYAFTRAPAQENDLQYRSYENLVRGELNRLGLREAAGAPAALKVNFEYGIRGRDVRVLQPVVVDPYWYGPSYFGPRWGRHFPTFYDPFWPGAYTAVRDSQQLVFHRQLRLTMEKADGKKVYDVTVNSVGTNGNLAVVMPYMVASAFRDFPGPSGQPRVVELEMKEPAAPAPEAVK